MEYYNDFSATNKKFMETIRGLNEAFLDERSDLVYYEYLAGMAPTMVQKEIIYSIMRDERVNATLFRRMYEEITGSDVSYDPKEELVIPDSYLPGISEAINRESRELERYKGIREGFPTGSPYIYTLSNIIANELNHITQFNSILSSNNNINNLQIINSSKNEDLLEQQTANFTLDDWARFIRPLVSRALSEDGNRNTVEFFRKLILSGILIGLGNRPLEAIELVERWEEKEAPKPLRIGKISTCI